MQTSYILHDYGSPTACIMCHLWSIAVPTATARSHFRFRIHRMRQYGTVNIFLSMGKMDKSAARASFISVLAAMALQQTPK